MNTQDLKTEKYIEFEFSGIWHPDSYLVEGLSPQEIADYANKINPGRKYRVVSYLC